MKPIVISETIQEYKGKRYFLCGFYFQRKGIRLHRLVYEDYFGEIPSKHHVHHKDGNRANNDPQNLELMQASQHMSMHMNTEERKAYGRMHIERIRPKAIEWHKSKAGKEWHQKHYKNVTAKAIYKKIAKSCQTCGKLYETIEHGRNYFCSNACKSEWRRRSGTDDVITVCTNCKTEFVTNKYVPRKYCQKCVKARVWRFRSS